MTTVTNLKTGDEQTFSLPPDEAVVAAREQEKGNVNTWEYPKPVEHPEVEYGRFTVTCGDWCALNPDTHRELVRK